jgi:hypothetical protein
LIYRPRRFILPDGKEIDSLGRPYDPTVRDGPDELFMEKVSLSMVEDLTVGDGINLFTLIEAPYRPYLTYRARVALDGPLYLASSTQIRMPHAKLVEAPWVRSPHETPKGRIKSAPIIPRQRFIPGPEAHDIQPLPEPETDKE